jgi:hypothetical protein
MASTKRELQGALDMLAKHKKQWQLEYPDPAIFWPAYKGAAKEILDAAGPLDRFWVEERLWEIMEGR